jgi:hypothetical protein
MKHTCVLLDVLKRKDIDSAASAEELSRLPHLELAKTAVVNLCKRRVREACKRRVRGV